MYLPPCLTAISKPALLDKQLFYVMLAAELSSFLLKQCEKMKANLISNADLLT